MSTELPALDDVRLRRVARHKDVRFETGARCIGRQRAAGVSSAWGREFGRAQIFCHRNGHTHSAGLETLRWVKRFVFDPKIDLIVEGLRAQQWCSAFTQRNRLNEIGRASCRERVEISGVVVGLEKI